jgi:hypothetical protein
MLATATVRGEARALDPMWPKLEGLDRLSAVRTDAFAVPAYVEFSVSDWKLDKGRILARIASRRLGPVLIVRSCAAMEDRTATEPPGFFESILGIDAGQAGDVALAIDEVCRSYQRRQDDAPLSHKVLVQTQLTSPALSGVCRVGEASDDYLEIEYDESPARTDAVTAGLRARQAYLSPHLERLSEPWRALRKAMDEVRGHFKAPFFVEFALDREGAAWIFQVRADRRPRQAVKTRPPRPSELDAAERIVAVAGPLSDMADWNPAEMLGRDPKPLDISLYDDLLMSGAWAQGRASLGWRAPRELGLMVEVGGRPYIRLPVSLQTLLPKGISERLADALVVDRLRLLADHPDLHDKVEFRVMWSAYAFDDVAVKADLLERGFSDADVQNLFMALRRVTRRTLTEAAAHLQADRAGMFALKSARARLLKLTAASSPAAVAREIRAALDVCRTSGTIPFSRQARTAFSFRYIVSHLVATGALRAEAVQEWEAGLNTVARQLTRAVRAVGEAKLSRAAFDRRFGHLRPRTYSLESLRYDERPVGRSPGLPETRQRRPAPPAAARLGEILTQIGAEMTQRQFWAAAADAYRAREEVKFGFTALLSDVLLTLGRVATWSGVERSTLRALRIGDLLRLLRNARDWTGFADGVDRTHAERPDALRWPMPAVLLSRDDLHVVVELEPQPTFIGLGSAEGPPRLITGEVSFEAQLAGAVLAIEAPDPGFDWVFSQPLAGLVTAYGGEFSHMGVRCAEFRIPAALGCGPMLFDNAAKAAFVTIDGSAGEVWADGRRLYPHG